MHSKRERESVVLLLASWEGQAVSVSFGKKVKRKCLEQSAFFKGLRLPPLVMVEQNIKAQQRIKAKYQVSRAAAKKTTKKQKTKNNTHTHTRWYSCNNNFVK